ncbi:MAG: hypothetical protein AAFZ92_01180 [Pseudomonadota bacterium]
MAAGKIGVLSSQCCNANAKSEDAKLMELVEQCMEETNTYLDIKAETITAAQKGMGSLGSDIDQAEQIIVEQITGLFQKGGMRTFPALIIDRKIISYGGVPTKEVIIDALKTVDRKYVKSSMPELDESVQANA